MNEGQSIGRFRVERLLGEGGIAQVFQVRHRQLGTLHALKLLTVNSSGLAERLLQEGRIQANIRHPNLVSVTDVVEHKGQIGLVMEYVEGFSLDDCLREGAMDLVEALDIFGQVLSGVATAHAAGVLHRDLKPGNILLTTLDDVVVAKVADFGIAKMTQVEGRTVGGTTMGTPGYMAPEQISDAAAVDKRADIFALGAILYEMVSGRRAFLGANMLDTLNRTADGRTTPLGELVRDCPTAVAEAVTRALMPDPADRFADCTEFLRALELSPDTLSDRAQTLEPIATEVPPPRDSSNPTLAPAAHTWAGEDEASPLTPRVTEPPTAPTQAAEPVEDPASRDEELNERWGLTDVEVDSSVPPLPRRPTPPPPRSLPPEEIEEDDEEQRVSPSHAVRAEGGSEVFAELIWPLLRGAFHAGRYMTLPVVILLFGGGAGATLGERELQVLEEQVSSTTVQLDQALTGQLGLVDELIQLGARPAILDPYVERYQRAESDRDRFKAAEALSGAMLEELRMLPATDEPELVQRRRQAEVQLHHSRERYHAYLEAMEAWGQGASTVKGTLAIKAGFAEAPPDWVEE
jgi:serine/threonine protein kinase